MGEKLGQHFLNDSAVVKKIITAADLTPSDVVIEVGPGKGILTDALVMSGARVIAIEWDEQLADDLQKKYAGHENITIVHGDIRRTHLLPLLRQHNTTTYKVIANLPYYITSSIIRLFLESDTPPKEMVIMVQKEVAERIVARPGQMSILAVSVHYYAHADILFTVPPHAFDPAPDVESAVLRIISDTHRAPRDKESVKKFFRMVRAGFSARRKTLLNNIANAFHLDKTAVQEKLRITSLTEKTRAQELSVAQWEKLSRLF